MKLLYIISIFLMSCSVTQTQTQSIGTIYPAKPAPIQVAEVSWEVLEGNVCLSSIEGVSLNLQNKDTIRYIKDLQSRLCMLGDEQYCIKESE